MYGLCILNQCFGSPNEWGGPDPITGECNLNEQMTRLPESITRHQGILKNVVKAKVRGGIVFRTRVYLENGKA